MFFARPRVLVVSDDEGMKRCLSALNRKNVTGPLVNCIKTATSGQRHLVFAFSNLSTGKQVQQMGQMLPPDARSALSILDVTSGSVAMDFGDTAVFEAHLSYASEAKAQQAKQAYDNLKGMLDKALPTLQEQIKQGMPPDKAKIAGDALRGFASSLKGDLKGSDLSITVKVDTKALEALAPQPAPGVPPRR